MTGTGNASIAVNVVSTTETTRITTMMREESMSTSTTSTGRTIVVSSVTAAMTTAVAMAGSAVSVVSSEAHRPTRTDLHEVVLLPVMALFGADLRAVSLVSGFSRLLFNCIKTFITF